MSLKVLCDVTDEIACLYDSVYEKAFGPIFHMDSQMSAQEVAEDFLSWAKYNNVESSIDADTISILVQEYEQAKVSKDWPIESDYPEGEY